MAGGIPRRHAVQNCAPGLELSPTSIPLQLVSVCPSLQKAERGVTRGLGTSVFKVRKSSFCKSTQL